MSPPDEDEDADEALDAEDADEAELADEPPDEVEEMTIEPPPPPPANPPPKKPPPNPPPNPPEPPTKTGPPPPPPEITGCASKAGGTGIGAPCVVTVTVCGWHCAVLVMVRRTSFLPDPA